MRENRSSKLASFKSHEQPYKETVTGGGRGRMGEKYRLLLSPASATLLFYFQLKSNVLTICEL